MAYNAILQIPGFLIDCNNLIPMEDLADYINYYFENPRSDTISPSATFTKRILTDCLQNLQLAFIPIAFMILLPEVKRQLKSYTKEVKLFENGIPLKDLTDSSHSILEEIRNDSNMPQPEVDDPDFPVEITGNHRVERTPLMVNLKLDNIQRAKTTIV